MLTPEQLAAAHKANIEMLFGLTRQALEGVERLVELNLQATRAALRDAAGETDALLSAKDVQELLQRQAALLQPMAEKSLAYSRQLYEIAASTYEAFAQATQHNLGDAQHKVEAVVDNIARNAPAGSETAVAAMRHAVQAAAVAMETVQKAMQQASALAQTNVEHLTQQAQQWQQAAASAATAAASNAAPSAGRTGARARRSPNNA
ncbi:phasin: phasin family protein [Tepidimonas charontis]|uniref:Phasin: phasin family protein n=2 Tax=Tepidimonas charontis TaxID=2267262 RepID=A0A554XF92_9BURK|nr:phasin: phasin family protein [Tepidimonas charontis]